MKVDGFDELNKKLDKMRKAAEELEKGETVSFDVLFNNAFMKKHTKFSSFDELLENGNFTVNSQDDFEALPESELDAHIEKTTNFSSWEDMLSSATTEYAAKKLGF